MNLHRISAPSSCKVSICSQFNDFCCSILWPPYPHSNRSLYKRYYLLYATYYIHRHMIVSFSINIYVCTYILRWMCIYAVYIAKVIPNIYCILYSRIYTREVYMIVYEYIPDICAIVRRLSFLQCCLCPHEFYKLCVTRILHVNGILYTHMLYICIPTHTHIYTTCVGRVASH